MNRTAELRWFMRGPPPGPVVAWFERATDPPLTRTDVYLALPDTDALGVKIRGGTTSFELKLRPRSGTPLELPNGISGQLEEWQKWSFSRSGLSRLLPRLGLPKGLWTTVRKQRRMTTIPDHGDSGCNLELTALTVMPGDTPEPPGGRTWSTLGFESFGPERDLVPALKAAAEQLFGAFELPGGLDHALSCGYPGWLATL